MRNTIKFLNFNLYKIWCAQCYHLTKLFAKNNTSKTADSFEYSKYQALIDAPEYAAEILIYGE